MNELALARLLLPKRPPQPALLLAHPRDGLVRANNLPLHRSSILLQLRNIAGSGIDWQHYLNKETSYSG